MLGATESLKASFAATAERRFIAALRFGSSGVDTHRNVIKLDPNFHDAELTIGMYDYIVGTLSLPVRMLASIAGPHGSKKRGIQTLERVAKEGQWTRDDAKVLLIAIYKKEKRFPEALALSRELQGKYPRNYLFRLETIVPMLQRQRRPMPKAWLRIPLSRFYCYAAAPLALACASVSIPAGISAGADLSFIKAIAKPIGMASRVML